MLFATALTNDSIATGLPCRSISACGGTRSEVMAVAGAEKARPMGFNGFSSPPPSTAGSRAPADPRFDRRECRAQPQIREVA